VGGTCKVIAAGYVVVGGCVYNLLYLIIKYISESFPPSRGFYTPAELKLILAVWAYVTMMKLEQDEP
jgi:bacteriorhodopsin